MTYKVFSHWKTVREPVYGWVEEVVGYREERVPVYGWRKVPVGTERTWRLQKVPELALFLPEFLEAYFGADPSEAEAAALRAVTLWGAAVGGPVGEWFYDPRSQVPYGEVHPAAVMAMLLELSLLGEQEPESCDC